MITIIKYLNNVISKGNLILHIEPSSTAIKSLIKMGYTLYIHKDKEDAPVKLWSTSRTIKSEDEMGALEKEITEEILRFVIKGNLSQYE